MRNLLVILLLLCSLALRAQGVGSISVIPGVPVNGVPTTFVLSPAGPPVGAVAWDFGDGTTLSGGTVASHLYVQTGSYLVRASYVPFAGQLVLTAQLPIRVADRLGPAAPFTISMLRVRWEDGRTDVSVDQGFSPLTAFADLKFEGTGLLQAQWVVDGIPLSTFTQQLAFAGTVTLDSRRAIPLPTTGLGEHLVTLRILAPVVPFQSPQIRYFVRVAGGEEVPRIDAVFPAVVHPGDEAELSISGRRLEPGTAVSFGRDIAVVAPLRFTGPGRAVAKVFVAPTALVGSREVQAFSRGGRSRGPARLQVVPPPLGASPIGSASVRPVPALPWSGSREARPNLLRTLTAFFLLPVGEEGRAIFAPPAPRP